MDVQWCQFCLRLRKLMFFSLPWKAEESAIASLRVAREYPRPAHRYFIYPHETRRYACDVRPQFFWSSLSLYEVSDLCVASCVVWVFQPLFEMWLRRMAAINAACVHKKVHRFPTPPWLTSLPSCCCWLDVYHADLGLTSTMLILA